MPRRGHEVRISVRCPKERFPKLKERLARCADIAKVNESDIVLAAVSGACDFIEENRQDIMLPVREAALSHAASIERIERFIKLMREKKP